MQYAYINLYILKKLQLIIIESRLMIKNTLLLDLVPCPQGSFVMSPAVSAAMTGWSECTR